MPKIIVKIKHLKSSKKVGGLIDYVAKREGVDKTVNEKILIGKPTEKQLEFIDKMLSECPDVKKTFEYEDYIENPTKQNASALITTIAENNPDALGSKETYINYIATRPRVEKLSSHGLFGSEENVNLSEVKKEIENINGVVWTPIISLKREDAERLGYDNADMWRSLIRSKQMELAEIFDIPFDEFKWYGAFHNEAGHPHIHMVVYATGDAKGYITERDIEKVKSVFANEIFKNEMYELYDDKTKAREKLAEETRAKIKALADSIREKDYSQSELCEMLVNLSVSLKTCRGKKVYGYLPTKVKKEVDEILKTISKDEDVQRLYNEWCMLQRKIYGIYTDKDVEFAPLWENKEFKKLKNAIVSEAEKLGDSRIYVDEETEKEEQKNDENGEYKEPATDNPKADTDNRAKNINPTVISSAANLFCRLASIIENDTKRKTEGFYKTIVDSKERKHIIRKKQSLGMKMR